MDGAGRRHPPYVSYRPSPWVRWARTAAKAGGMSVVAVALLWGASHLLRRHVLVRVDLGIRCTPERHDNCFVSRRGVVSVSYPSTMRIALDEPPYMASASGYTWKDPPLPGAQVIVHRWEGENIAYVTDVARGRRFGTDDAPDADRFGSGVAAIILALVGAVFLNAARQTWAELRPSTTRG